MPANKPGLEDKSGVQFRPLQLALELGYVVAIPIIIFALAGRFADRYFDTSPWLLLAGICLSILVSSFLVYKKVIGVIHPPDNDS